MSGLMIQIPSNFNWETEDGELLNLLLNIMGGLSYEDLTKEEKVLLEKSGFKL